TYYSITRLSQLCKRRSRLSHSLSTVLDILYPPMASSSDEAAIHSAKISVLPSVRLVISLNDSPKMLVASSILCVSVDDTLEDIASIQSQNEDDDLSPMSEAELRVFDFMQNRNLPVPPDGPRTTLPGCPMTQENMKFGTRSQPRKRYRQYSRHL
ncbi:hypothetical protein K435DRAFT_897498, partial [Dendrothele bispora CBS 962.96]